jgi:hypothetical protein
MSIAVFPEEKDDEFQFALICVLRQEKSRTTVFDLEKGNHFVKRFVNNSMILGSAQSMRIEERPLMEAEEFE